MEPSSIRQGGIRPLKLLNDRSRTLACESQIEFGMDPLILFLEILNWKPRYRVKFEGTEEKLLFE